MLVAGGDTGGQSADRVGIFYILLNSSISEVHWAFGSAFI